MSEEEKRNNEREEEKTEQEIPALKPKIVVKTPMSKGWDDPEKIGKVLESVSDLLEDLSEIVEDLIDKLTESLDGAKIGKEVGEFYKQLKESGVPDDVAIEMTKEFFKKRTMIAEQLVSALKEVF